MNTEIDSYIELYRSVYDGSLHFKRLVKKIQKALRVGILEKKKKVTIPFNYSTDGEIIQEVLKILEDKGYKIKLLSEHLGGGAFKYEWEVEVYKPLI